MPYREQKPDSAKLFVHDKKGNPKAPDRSGPLDVTCRHCGKSNRLRLSGWINPPKDGKQGYMNLAVSDPQEKKQGGRSDDSIDNW